MSSYSSTFVERNQYWIPSFYINKKVITQEIQYYLGPDATVRPYTREGEDGFLITTPGECLTDVSINILHDDLVANIDWLKEQIDDICRKSEEVYEKRAAARSKKETDKQLKRPLHQPIKVSSRTSKNTESSRSHRHSAERGEGSGRQRSHERRYDTYDRRDMW